MRIATNRHRVLGNVGKATNGDVLSRTVIWDNTTHVVIQV